jgi:uncharacterized protein involved in exopolysaccharide biosynthesis
MKTPQDNLDSDNQVPSAEIQQEQETQEQQHSFWIRSLVYGSHLSLKERRRLYFRVFFLSSFLVWALVVSFLTLKPSTYTSEWTLILPGSGSGQTVNLESIGQASASSASPYSHSSIDPIVNYKAISTSSPVLKDAAQSMEMSVGAFGKPRIKLVDQTALIKFEIKGRTAEESQQKALNLYQSFQHHLNLLRDDEQAKVTKASLQTLSSFSSKLEQAQQEKLSYQTQSGVLSIEQFNQLILQLENRRVSYQDLTSTFKSLKAQNELLQRSLNMTDKEVNIAVNLRNDALFQEYLNRHAGIHTQIATTEGTWGKNHPKLIQLEAAHVSVNNEITIRGRRLVNDTKISTWQLIEIGSTKFENQIFQKLIEQKATVSGIEQQLLETAQSIQKLESRIANSASDAIKIEDLGRKQQVATAVFSTALAKQDISKSDRFASYPLVQILSEPSLPEKADRLALAMGLFGGIFSTFSIAIGLILLWIRKPWLQKILKNA